MKRSCLFVAIFLLIHVAQAQTSITIGNQVWMDKNLDVSTYRNGDSIPQVTDPAAWASLTTGAWCWYNNDPVKYGSVYGKLYNWYAVNDPRGLAPPGWHIPSDSEWTKLYDHTGGYESGKGALKEKGKTHWHAPNLNATNSSGFTALPGGRRDQFGPFKGIELFGHWWSATEQSEDFVWARMLEYLNGFLTSNFFPKKQGYSVRCLRD